MKKKTGIGKSIAPAKPKPPGKSAPMQEIEPQTAPRFIFAIVIVFVIALLVRLVYIWQIRDAVFFDLKMGDAETYDQWARQIAAGDWIGKEVFQQAPLYPYFLGLIYAIFGTDALVLRLCQAVIGALSCVLLADATRRLFKRPGVGLAAGILAALYAPAIFFDVLIQKSVLDMLFMSLCLWLISRLAEVPRLRTWFGLGLAMGGLTLTRENAILMLPVLLIWALLHFRKAGVKRWGWAGLMLAGFLAVTLPVGLRNLAVGGEFVPTTAQLGLCLWIGNNPQADGTYQALIPGHGVARYEPRDAQQLAEQAAGRALSPAQVSQFFVSQAVHYAKSQPLEWLKLEAMKFALFLNTMELVDTESLESYAERSSLLRVLYRLFNFGVLAPLAVLGLWLTWSRRRDMWVLYMLMLAYVASAVLFFIIARYRYPLAILMIPFAATVFVAPWRVFAGRAKRQIVVGVLLFMIAVVFCNWPMAIRAEAAGVTENNVGAILEEQGRLDEAVAQYRHAIKRQPKFYGAHVNLARALYMVGNPVESQAEFNTANSIRLDQARALVQLGQELEARGMWRKAMQQYTLALNVQRDQPDALAALSRLQAQKDRRDAPWAGGVPYGVPGLHGK
jgi:4-amino-4-deoxy-L-arabinose transferase-like glycosyltransferase